MLCQCLLETHRRSHSMHLLQHTIINYAQLEKCVELNYNVYNCDAETLGAHLVNKYCNAALRANDSHALFTASTGERMLLHEQMGQWQRVYGCEMRCFAWPAYTPVAYALTTGHLRTDITALVPRDCFRIWTPPLLPSRAVRRSLQKTQGCKAASFAEIVWQDSDTRERSSNRQRVQLEEVRSRLDAIEASADVCNLGSFRIHAVKMMKFFYPHDWQDRSLQLRTTSHTSKQTLARSRVRLDVAAMLWARHCNSNRSMFRYVSCDASPQLSQSIEVFVSVERVVNRTALDNKQFADVSPSAFATRLMPLCTLGQGRAALQDKVSALVHQTWCEYGPNVEDVRTACCSVRQVLTDMGVEFGIANYPDVVSQCLKDVAQHSSEHASADCYLFPLALQVPGVMHILDWVVKETVDKLPFWPEWQIGATRLCQYMHSHNHRALMQKIIRDSDDDPQHAEQLCGQLDRGTTRFAKWRWKTLHHVVSDIIRIEDAVRFVAGSCNSFAKSLAIRDAKEASALQALCLDAATWSRARAIGHVIRRVIELTSWVQGCDCHEQELLQGKQVDCPMKGCRSKTFAAQISSVASKLHADRTALVQGQFGDVDVAVVHVALTHSLMCLQSKLHWVNELPYLVWQVLYNM